MIIYPWKPPNRYCSRFFAMCPRHGESAKFSFGRAGEVCGYVVVTTFFSPIVVCTDTRFCVGFSWYADLMLFVDFDVLFVDFDVMKIGMHNFYFYERVAYAYCTKYLPFALVCL